MHLVNSIYLILSEIFRTNEFLIQKLIQRGEFQPVIYERNCLFEKKTTTVPKR